MGAGDRAMTAHRPQFTAAVETLAQPALVAAVLRAIDVKNA